MTGGVLLSKSKLVIIAKLVPKKETILTYINFSSILDRDGNKLIGLQLFTTVLPFLNIGIPLDFLKADMYVPVVSDRLKI